MKLDQKQEAIQLRITERLSNREIAGRLGVSSGTVSRWLQPYKLTEIEIQQRWRSGNTRKTNVTVGVPSMGVCKKGHVNPLRHYMTRACLECKRRSESLRASCDHKKFPEKEMWSNAKFRAKRFEIPFNITVEDIRAVWPQDNRCPILGILFEVGRSKGPDVDSPTLDRVIPKSGYVVGNIAVISKRANAMKNDEVNPDNFRRLADWLESFGKQS